MVKCGRTAKAIIVFLDLFIFEFVFVNVQLRFAAVAPLCTTVLVRCKTLCLFNLASGQMDGYPMIASATPPATQ